MTDALDLALARLADLEVENALLKRALCEPPHGWSGAWINANEVEMSAWRFQARAAISAFLAASPLTPGDGNKE